MVHDMVSAHELLTISFISFAVLYNLVRFRWLHISFLPNIKLSSQHSK